MKYPIPRKQQFNLKTYPQSKERMSVAIFTRVGKNVGSCFWFIEKTIAVFYVVVVERVVDIRNTTPTTRGHFCRLCGMLVPDLATYLDVLSLPGGSTEAILLHISKWKLGNNSRGLYFLSTNDQTVVIGLVIWNHKNTWPLLKVCIDFSQSSYLPWQVH